MMICDVMLGDGDWGNKQTPQRESSCCTCIPVSAMALAALAWSNRLIVTQADSRSTVQSEKMLSAARKVQLEVGNSPQPTSSIMG
jgi:hypothetical protein